MDDARQQFLLSLQHGARSKVGHHDSKVSHQNSSASNVESWLSNGNLGIVCVCVCVWCVCVCVCVVLCVSLCERHQHIDIMLCRYDI